MEIIKPKKGSKFQILSRTYKGQRNYDKNEWAEMGFFTTDVEIKKECFAFITCSICFSNAASGLNAGFRFVKFVEGSWEAIKKANNNGNRLGMNFSEQPKPDADQHLTIVSYSICDVLQPGTTKLSMQMRATDTDTIYFNRPKRYDNQSFIHNTTSTFTVFLYEGVSSKSTSSNGIITYESFVSN